MSYEVMDVSADIGLRAKGDSLQDCFKNAGLGLYSLITDPQQLHITESRQIKIEADSVEDLLVSYLNELIFLFDTEGFIGKDIEIEIKNHSLNAKVYGEIFQPQKHEQKLLIKAATYHNLVLKKQNNLWIAEIIFDI